MDMFIKRWLSPKIWITLLSLLSLGLMAGVFYFNQFFPSFNQLDSPTTTKPLATQLFKIPLYFESNEGQVDSSVKYFTRGKGYTFYFTPKEIVMVLQKKLQEIESSTSSILKLQFIGSNLDPLIRGMEKQEYKSHYFRGNDSSQWHTDIPNFAKVCYQNLYPGIDVAFYGNQQKLEYDILVSPGQNPKNAIFHLEGAKELAIDENGNLCIFMDDEQKLQMQKPFVYQNVDGNQVAIDGQFVLLAKQDVGFIIGKYDESKLLVIDPVLDYSSYLGGSLGDTGNGIAVDSAGNAYITGTTSSLNFPTVNAIDANLSGTSDVFVTKVSPTGSALIYSTYLGGSAADEGLGIAVDSTGNAYVTGETISPDFPTLNAFQGTLLGTSDAFVTKISPTGSALVYSTYLGGSSTDRGNAITVDSTGNAYITGFTFSLDFPTLNPFQAARAGATDAFVTKLDFTGSALVYSTYLGGSSGDFGNGIAVDSAGSAYVTGQTSSSNFPTLNPFQAALSGTIDAFVTKFSPTGSTLVYSTYLGGTGSDIGNNIAVDSAGNAYVIGDTNSINFPTTAGVIQPTFGGGPFDAFITKFSPTGSTLVYSTYLGGNDFDEGFGIAVDSAGNAYVTGATQSPNFPTVNPIKPALTGTSDAFVTKINPTGTALVYSTYLGGSNIDRAFSIAIDTTGSAYVTGVTLSTDFPTVNAFQPIFGGVNDAFVVKILSAPVVTSISPTFGPESGGTVVTITGFNFTGTTAVLFGATPAASFIVVSDTEIIAVSPPGVGTVDVRVTTPEGTSPITPADQFTYIPAPIVTGVIPNSGPESGGTTVTITGVNFTGATAVFFGATPATSFTVISDTAIIAVSPPGVGTVDVRVTTPGGTSAITPADQFTYIPAPVITGVVPDSGPESGGTLVTITGANFTGATTVLFGDVPAAFFVISDTEIRATSPPGTGTVDIRVITPNGISAITPADQFTYLSGPGPVILPPEDVRGRQVKNRFATQTDIVNIITWHSPSTGERPVAYKIFRDAALTKLAKIVWAKGQNQFKFKDHNRKEGKVYTYFIVSVDAAGNQSSAAIVKVKPRD